MLTVKVQNAGSNAGCQIFEADTVTRLAKSPEEDFYTVLLGGAEITGIDVVFPVYAVYVMNSSGKTVETFYPLSYISKSEK